MTTEQERIAQLEAELATLQASVRELLAENAALKRRLAQESHTSSTPPAVHHQPYTTSRTPPAVHHQQYTPSQRRLRAPSRPAPWPGRVLAVSSPCPCTSPRSSLRSAPTRRWPMCSAARSVTGAWRGGERGERGERRRGRPSRRASRAWATASPLV